MSEKKYTDYEMIERIWDNEEVKTVMARHAYLLSGDQRRRELNELWVQEPAHRRSASLGLNNGFYSGMDEIVRYYVVEHDALRQEQLKPYLEANPKMIQSPDTIGTGIMNIHSANTPIIYVADDGQTAKYLAFDFGLHTVGKPGNDCDAYFISGNIYCELIKEAGEWKIWHLVLEHDHSIPVGENYGNVPVYLRPGDDPVAEEAEGVPTIARTIHEPLLGWEHLYQDMPKPYHTYNPLHSYGPEGDIGMRYYEREQRY